MTTYQDAIRTREQLSYELARLENQMNRHGTNPNAREAAYSLQEQIEEIDEVLYRIDMEERQNVEVQSPGMCPHCSKMIESVEDAVAVGEPKRVRTDHKTTLLVPRWMHRECADAETSDPFAGLVAR